MSAYAGVGSRETPPEVLDLFRALALKLGQDGWTLRTGGADGADRAFWDGARGYRRQLFLPHPGFFRPTDLQPLLDDVFDYPSAAAFATVEAYHPAPWNLREYARALHARNAHQVLGRGLQEPVSMVVCWTPGGKGAGGTGQAIRIAHHHRLPVFDAGSEVARRSLASWIDNA